MDGSSPARRSAAAAAAAPFSNYFASPALSDCTLTISTLRDDDEPNTPSAKRQKGGSAAAADVLPGHAIVLSTSSAWMRRQIEAWGAAENAPPPFRGADGGGAAAPPCRQPNISLQVRPGQEEAARRLVRFIYEGPGSMPAAAAAAAQGAAGQACQALLVDMLALSHAFRVPTCAAACLERLLAVPLRQLAWSTVSQVLRLPAPHLGGGGDAARLVAACLDRLQGDFGDLEAVARDPHALSRLCALPFQAVHRLLLDERTAAASENTALAVAHAWLAAQTPGAAGMDERRALAGAVRLPQLEPLALATVVPRMGWLCETLGVEGLALAAGAARGQFDCAAEPVLSTQVPALPPAWLRGPRPVPASVAGPDGPRLTFEWSVPIHQLRQLFEDTVAAAAAAAAAAVAAAAAAELPPDAAAAPACDETDGGSVATGGGGAGGGSALSLLGAGLFGWRRGGTSGGGAGGGGGSVSSTPTKRPLQESAVNAAPAAAVQPAAPRQQPAPPQRQPSLRLRSPPAVFAGHRFNLVMYFQEEPSGPAACDDGEADDASAPAASGPGRSQAARGGRGRRGRGQGGAAAAAAAEREQQQQQQREEQRRQQEDEPSQMQSEQGTGASAGAGSWSVRLAVEAAPCVPLRGPSSVVAFCGRLSALRVDRDSPVRSAAGESGPAASRRGGRGSDSSGGGSDDDAAGDGDGDAASDAGDGDAASDAGEGEGGVWEARELPQGSWVRSRACDTGFRSFFGFQLPRGRWSARPFAPFLVGPEGGALRLKCELFNVR
ncbi:hypothetical protein Rsub_08458 [Raphidocelis subcapitata]|uniref:BACK domain-containing protein n=1 Tax=Raphidocelis subcapitata TaxID=307507 RepID=A0A2V0PF95_9CHLO|nr:hypothetical protein Rsub_08458 [Raphidocelis subcapitata]|eukprot:GBF95867.1 hypothetical protein Rsub_08458 [Raphidocelis subcapitata]